MCPFVQAQVSYIGLWMIYLNEMYIKRAMYQMYQVSVLAVSVIAFPPFPHLSWRACILHIL